MNHGAQLELYDESEKRETEKEKRKEEERRKQMEIEWYERAKTKLAAILPKIDPTLVMTAGTFETSTNDTEVNEQKYCLQFTSPHIRPMTLVISQPNDDYFENILVDEFKKMYAAELVAKKHKDQQDEAIKKLKARK